MNSPETEEKLLEHISRLKRENRKLSRIAQTAQRILSMSNLMGMGGNFEEQMPLIMQHLSALVDAERSSLFLMSGEHMSLILMSRFSEKLEHNIQLDLKMGLVGTCILNNRVINAANAYDNPYFNPDVDKKTGFRTESVLCVPISRKGEVLGAVELINKESGVFSKEDERRARRRVADAFGHVQGDTLDKEGAAELLAALRQELQCACGSVYVLDRAKSELTPLVVVGAPARDVLLNVKLGVAGFVAVTGQDVIIADAYNDVRFNPSVDAKTGFRTEQLLCVPLIGKRGDTIGVLQAINKKEGTFDQDDLAVLKNVAPFLCMYLENFLLCRDYQQQFISFLEVMAASIDAKDPLTATHSQNVSRYAKGIARELGFPDEEIDIINVAAWLHDYGKIGIKETVLKKSGRLTREEFDHIKQHTKNTRIILEKMYFSRRYRHIPFIAACHHERLDGSGYNEGLTADKIPFMAKIIAVADVFDALTAERHYREALSPEKAFAELDKGIGSKFDGNVVDAMKRYWSKEGGRRD